MDENFAALLDQVERRPQPAVKVLAASEFLDAGRDREAMALNRRARELEFDILQVCIENTNLTRDVERDRRRFLQAFFNRHKLLDLRF